MYEYNDGSKNGGRKPRLYLAKGAEYVKFEGNAIEGFCAIASSKFTKNGKWSNTTYQLELAQGVRPIYMLSRLHGIWGEDFETWGQVTQMLGLPIAATKAIVEKEYPKTAERLNKLEEFQAAAEEAGIETEKVVISFGSPTRKEFQSGFWSMPKVGHTSTGMEVKIRPGDGDDWSKPVVISPAGATVTDSKKTPGGGGGYYDITVEVPIQ